LRFALLTLYYIKTNNMIDLIGDIHGHADKLKELLVKLDYSKQNGFYSHPDRKVLFIGDYIDRGPKMPETLEIVKAMVENNSAIALMGNHEYNALCFHAHQSNGGHVRPHLIKNIVQHYETLKQFQNRQDEYEDYLEWFKTLPLFYENDYFRAVHACWDNDNIAFLKSKLVDNKLTDELILESTIKGSQFNDAIDQTLKGKELKIPDGKHFKDKDGTKRTNFRIKWWENPGEMTYRNISVESIVDLPQDKIVAHHQKDNQYYLENEKPVFFGHYWLNMQDSPSLFKDNVCCLDFSVAKEGHLVAYRMDNEHKLDESKFVFV
jgi:hypothetical protein